MSQPTAVEHIQCAPGICGGKPCVAGTRIRVQDIMVWHELQGLSADEIVTQFPQLSLADVHAALAYYYDHREEIQREISEAKELARAMKAAGLSPLQRKLSDREADDAQVPPG